MALRGGESVGRAYVRIYATGDEVPGDIRRIMEEAEPSVAEGGREHGRVYEDEFDKEARKTFKTKFGKTKKEMFHDLNHDLASAVRDLDLARAYFDGPEWKKFLNKLDAEFGAAGRLAGKNLEKEFRDSADLDQLADRMRHVGVDVRRAQEQIVSAMYNDAYRMNREFNDNLQRIEKERLTTARKVEQDSLRGVTLFRNRFKDIVEQIDRLEAGERGVGRGPLIRMLGQLKDMAPSIAASDHELVRWVHHIDDQNRRLREATPLMSKMIHGWDNISDRMGRLFGRGSRNDFLNFFGNMVRGIVSVVNIIPRAIQFLQRFGAGIREAFVAGGGGLSGTFDAFVKGVTSLGGALLAAAAAGVIFVAFIGFLGVVLGPVVALLSTFVGLLLAMASSAIFAAIGAIAGFGPLLLGAGGAVAGVIALVQAIKNASDASPRLKAAISGVRDEASGLWKLFQDKALTDLPGVLDQTKHALEGAKPLVDGMAEGFRRMLNEVADGIDSPAMNKFFERFGRFLPHTMDRLGKMISDVFGGLGGILRAAIPSANHLSRNLVDILDSFNKWANSGKGQQQIKDFLDRAGDSASAVADFLEGAWNWLKKLIDKSESTGDDLWTRLGGKFQEWADWIDKHPDAFQQWMDDSAELAGNISDVVDGLNELIDTLDTPKNRKTGGDLLSGLGWFLAHLGDLITIADSGIVTAFALINKDKILAILEPVWEGIKEVGKAAWYIIGGAWVGDLFHGIADAFNAGKDWVEEHVGGFFSSLAHIGGPGASGGGMIGLNLINTGAITRQMTRALDALGKLPGAVRDIANRAGEAMSGLAGRLAGPARTAANKVSNAFESVPGRVRSILSGLQGIASRSVSAVAGAYRSIDTRIRGYFASIPGQVQSILSRLQGIASRTATQVVNGFSGLGAKLRPLFSGAADAGANALHNIVDQVSGIPGEIVGFFTGLGGRISAAIGSIHINWPDPPGWLNKFTATGGIFAGAQARIIGEAGPEAVVPLDRPLSQVDPSVRWLSALAQGKTELPGGAGGHNKLVSADGWTIVTPSENPRIVATEVLNELVARVV